MIRYVRSALRTSVLAIAAALASACAGETPLGPNSAADLGADFRKQELGVCENVSPPDGARFVRRLYAKGVQIYSWNGASWGFVAPDAVLSADPRGSSIVGSHYAGPTWESNGSTVTAAVAERCTPNPNAIPWLLLSATSQSPGAFGHVAFIQRLNTEGGNAPSQSGTFVGQEARVPYTAIYVFYRSK